MRSPGATYPLDLVRSRLSIATASIPLQTEQALPSSSVMTASGAKQALASAYHTSSSSLNQTIFKRAELTMVGMTLKVMREEGGVPGLYRGMVTTAVGVAPYVGINFATYEALRGVMTPPGKNNVMRKLACGALAGTFIPLLFQRNSHQLLQDPYHKP
jgi:solute carrier family 25 phosphate transporter 23/24/25/41